MRPERGGVWVKLMGGAGGPPPSPWRTPTPYIFLALSFMMGVVAVALAVLICMRKKLPSSSPQGADEKAAAEAAAAARALDPLHREPKVVVFMPGDHDAPSFVASAKPLGGDGAAAV
jgi:hypothetical protein